MLCGQKNKAPSAVAKELGLSSGTISAWKRGVIPKQKTLQAVAEYFGVSVWTLLGDNEQPEVTDSTSSVREEMRDSYGFRVLFDAIPGASEADLFEAAALIVRRKEERKNSGNS